MCERIEALCTISKDGFAGRAGEPLKLEPFQRQLIYRMFARGPDGRRRHRVCFIGEPRKNGKSGIASGFALDGLLFDGQGAEVYAAAAEKDQARIVFGETKRMILANEELLAACTPMRDVIEVKASNSIFRCLSAEAYSKEGLNISRAIVDELHAHPTRELWDVLDLGTGARQEPLIVVVTTAGVKTDATGRDSICYELFKYGVDVAGGVIDDPSFFFAWWGAPDGADHRDPDVWRAANPGYGTILNPQDLADKVKRTPENEFRTKRLNQWVSSSQAWLPAGVWDGLADPDKRIPAGARSVLAFDGSRTGDSTGLLVISCEATPHIEVLGCWERPPNAPPDWQVDRAHVLATIRRARDDFEVAEMAADLYLWQTEVAELELEGLLVNRVNQTGSVMVPITARFFEAAMVGNFTHSGDPRLARHVDNAILRYTRAGPQLAKESQGSPRKIDLAVAAVMGLSSAVAVGLDQGDPHIW